jgi:sec-independent protein translocase protein TatA
MSLGIWQILLIVLLVLLLFGAGKLPAVMGDLAKGVKNFKKGLDEDDSPTNKKSSKK